MDPGWITQDVLKTLAMDQTTMHRVYSGYEGWVERLGEDYLLTTPGEIDARQWPQKIQSWGEENGLLVERVFWKQLQPNPADPSPYALLTGQSHAAIRTRCQELGVRYWIDFASGYSYGFFIDQRENRRCLRQLQSKRLLNLFAYTCSFSVVAALAGAETCSVDVARKALEWGKENFALNGLPTTGHRFMTDDAREAVRRMIKRGERFDTIVCDPPTFGRNREGKVWKIDKDLPRLVESLVELLLPGGHLLLSTNFTEWGEEHLAGLVSGRATVLDPLSHPIDLPVEAGARTVWVQVNL
jgi:23S rRNA (cytosine1962-C5)-methyltransferase